VAPFPRLTGRWECRQPDACVGGGHGVAQHVVVDLPPADDRHAGPGCPVRANQSARPRSEMMARLNHCVAGRLSSCPRPLVLQNLCGVDDLEVWVVGEVGYRLHSGGGCSADERPVTDEVEVMLCAGDADVE
jgi:hypothetical protein